MFVSLLETVIIADEWYTSIRKFIIYSLLFNYNQQQI